MLLILCILPLLIYARPEGSSVILVHLKYQLSPCCENRSIAEQGFFFFFCLRVILREKIAAVKSKALGVLVLCSSCHH